MPGRRLTRNRRGLAAPGGERVRRWLAAVAGHPAIYHSATLYASARCARPCKGPDTVTPNKPTKPMLLLLPEAPDADGEPRAALLVPHVRPGRRPKLRAFLSIAAALAAKRDMEAGR